MPEQSNIDQWSRHPQLRGTRGHVGMEPGDANEMALIGKSRGRSRHRQRITCQHQAFGVTQAKLSLIVAATAENRKISILSYSYIPEDYQKNGLRRACAI
jgi:hypothetical protein